jgi:hypothetical protein
VSWGCRLPWRARPKYACAGDTSMNDLDVVPAACRHALKLSSMAAVGPWFNVGERLLRRSGPATVVLLTGNGSPSRRGTRASSVEGMDDEKGMP